MKADATITFDTKVNPNGFKDGITTFDRKIAPLTQKLARQTATLKKQVDAVDELQRKYDEFASGEVEPKSLKEMEKQLERNHKLAEVLEKQIEAATQVSSMDANMYGENSKHAAESRAELNSLYEKLGEIDAQSDSIAAAMERIRLDPSTSAEAENLARKLEQANAQVAITEKDVAITGQQIAEAMNDDPVDKFARALGRGAVSARTMGMSLGRMAGGAGSLRGSINGLTNMFFMMRSGMDAATLSAAAMWAAITLGITLAIAGITKLVKLFNDLDRDIGRVVQRIKVDLRQAIIKLYTGTNIYDTLREDIEALPGKVRSVGNAIIKHVSVVTKTIVGFIGNVAKSVTGLAQRLVSLAKSTVVFQHISSGISKVKSIIGEWLAANTDLRASLEGVQTALLNAFAPILERIVPILIVLLNILTQVIDRIAAFISMIFGAVSGVGGLTKAINGAGAAAGKQMKNVQGFDQLNRMQDDSSGGGIFANWGFDSKLLDDLMDKIRDFFTVADFARWFNVGAAGAARFAKALRSIDWKALRDGAKASATNLAGLLSGFLSDIPLWAEIGRFFAEGFNLINTWLYTFATEFHWKEAGRAIVVGILSFFSSFDAKLAADTINAWANGILNLLIEAVQNLSKNSRIIGGKIAAFLNGLDWVGVLTKCGKAVSGAAKLLFGIISEAFKDTSWINDLADGLAAMLDEIFSVDNAQGAIDSVKTLLSAVLQFMHRFFVQNEGIKKVGDALVTFIQGVIEWASDVENQQKVADIVNAIIDELLKVIKAIDKEKLIEIWESLSEMINWEKVVELIKENNFLKKLPQQLVDHIEQMITDTDFSGLVDALMDKFSPVKYALTGLGTLIGLSFVKNLSTSAMSGAAPAGTLGAQTFMGTAMSKLSAFGSKLSFTLNKGFIAAQPVAAKGASMIGHALIKFLAGLSVGGAVVNVMERAFPNVYETMSSWGEEMYNDLGDMAGALWLGQVFENLKDHNIAFWQWSFDSQDELNARSEQTTRNTLEHMASIAEQYGVAVSDSWDEMYAGVNDAKQELNKQIDDVTANMSQKFGMTTEEITEALGWGHLEWIEYFNLIETGAVEAADTLLTSSLESFDGISSGVEGVGDTIGSSFGEGVDAALAKLEDFERETVEKYLTAIENSNWDVAEQVIKDWTEATGKSEFAFYDMSSEAVSAMWAIEHESEQASNEITRLWGVANDDMVQESEKAWSEIVSTSSGYIDTLLSNIIDFVSSSDGKFKEFFSSMEEAGKSIVSGIADGINANEPHAVSAMQSVMRSIEEKVAMYATVAVDTIKTMMKDKAAAIVANAPSYIRELTNMYDTARNDTRTFSADMESATAQMIRQMTSAVQGQSSAFGNAFRSMMNSAIAAVESGMNRMIQGVNVGVSGLARAQGSVSLGASIRPISASNISIPRLAHGGLIQPNKPRAVIVGDNRYEDEIISPVSTMKQAVRDVLAEGGSSDSQVVALLARIEKLLEKGHVIEMNERELGRTVAQTQRRLQQQLGHSVV